MDLEDYRKEIDKIDSEITVLFNKRLEICDHIAEYKMQNDISIENHEREVEILDRVLTEVMDLGGGEPQMRLTADLFSKIFDLSKKHQEYYSRREKEL